MGVDSVTLFDHAFLCSIHLQLPLFLFDLGDRVEDEARSQAEAAQEHERCCEHGGGEAGHQSGAEVLNNNRNAEREPYGGEEQRDEAEELERAVVLEERADHGDDLDAVADRVELRLRSRGAVSVLHRDVLDAPAVVDGVDGELGLDLEALAQNGERLDERLAHGAVARHDVLKAVAVDPLDHGADQVVAESVEGALVLLGVGAVGQAIAHGHVRLARDDRVAERAGRFGGVGVVAVDHEVAGSVDVAEHLAADVALALARLEAHGGAMLARDSGRAVGRVVVVDVDRGPRELAVEVVDDLADGDGLVVAGNDDRCVCIVQDEYPHKLLAGC